MVQDTDNRVVYCLVGMPLAGKTTLGKMLAGRVGVDFVDSDLEIENYLGYSITTFIESHSIAEFREVEYATIANTLELEKSCVLSVGGGAFCHQQTQQLLLERTKVIFIDSPLRFLESRFARSNKSKRPLLTNKKKLRELYKKRLPEYKKAHHSLKVNKASIKSCLNDLVQIVTNDKANADTSTNVSR